LPLVYRILIAQLNKHNLILHSVYAVLSSTMHYAFHLAEKRFRRNKSRHA